MDCRQFRNKHVAFVDDLLPAVEMDAMQQHRAVCSRCSRHDTAIRRALMVAWNLPTIEPSPDFIARLNARLEQLGPAARVDVVRARPQMPSIGTFAALAAGIVVVAYMAIETTRYFAPSADSLPMVPSMSVAAFETTPAPIANAALVASVPTAMPVWPAVLMVGQAPMQFASMEFRESDFAR
jgi:hypothetical protein